MTLNLNRRNWCNATCSSEFDCDAVAPGSRPLVGATASGLASAPPHHAIAQSRHRTSRPTADHKHSLRHTELLQVTHAPNHKPSLVQEAQRSGGRSCQRSLATLAAPPLLTMHCQTISALAYAATQHRHRAWEYLCTTGGIDPPRLGRTPCQAAPPPPPPLPAHSGLSCLLGGGCSLTPGLTAGWRHLACT